MHRVRPSNLVTGHESYDDDDDIADLNATKQSKVTLTVVVGEGVLGWLKGRSGMRVGSIRGGF